LPTAKVLETFTDLDNKPFMLSFSLLFFLGSHVMDKKLQLVLQVKTANALLCVEK
jgi:hypothetical protein